MVAGAMPLVSGCYTYAPVDTAASPPVGTRLAFEVTDLGRVALSDRLGSGVRRIEGTLIANDSAQYVMNVWRVAQLNGEISPWSGERVGIEHRLVGGILERRISRSRTYLAAGVATAAIVLFANSQGLIGSADSDSPEEPGPGPVSSRVPRTP
jgi:hypothetical protein